MLDKFIADKTNMSLIKRTIMNYDSDLSNMMTSDVATQKLLLKFGYSEEDPKFEKNLQLKI